MEAIIFTTISVLCTVFIWFRIGRQRAFDDLLHDYNAEHVIDIACSMAKTAIKEAEVLYDENHPRKEEKE